VCVHLHHHRVGWLLRCERVVSSQCDTRIFHYTETSSMVCGRTGYSLTTACFATHTHTNRTLDLTVVTVVGLEIQWKRKKEEESYYTAQCSRGSYRLLLDLVFTLTVSMRRFGGSTFSTSITLGCIHHIHIHTFHLTPPPRHTLE
jgi:hypothetical protein